MKKLKIKKFTSDSVEPPKKKKLKRGIKYTILSAFLIGGIALISLILVFALYVIISSPDFNKDLLYSKESTVLYYADGTELSRFGAENRVLVNYDQLPQVLVDAIVATEDSKFFQHSGLDIARFAKATAGQLAGNDKAGGASTLTMQVVKQVYTNSNDTGIGGLVRKATDIYMSVFKVESNYTKEEIMEFYVNVMWFGNDGNLNYKGIYGVEQASQYYFGKSVSELTLAEASILAGMFQNPRLYNPYKNPVGVRNRQTIVLQLMVNHGYITEEEKEAVLAIPIESLVKDKTTSTTGSNQAVIDYVLEQVEEETDIDPYTTPIKIYTTIKPDVQNVLTELETGTLADSKGKVYDLFPNDVMQEAVAITSVEDGSVVAISGGRNYQAKGTNRATNMKRQPGSTAKILFDYGPYIEYLNGSPGTQLLDEATTYSNGTAIKNADGNYYGIMNMRQALAQSRNIPALRVFQEIEKEDINLIKDWVHNLGIDYGEELYESAAIGGFDGVSPLQMSAAYAAYARGGYYIKPYAFTKVEVVSTGEEIEYKYEKNKVMSEETAYLINDMLMTATAQGVSGVKLSNTDLCSKGGTTTIDKKKTQDLGIPANSTMDAWNITYSPEYAIALWIGYDRVTSDYYLNSTIGGTIRQQVMRAIAPKIYSANKHFDKPKGIVKAEIELETMPLQLASEYTPANLRSYELFKSGTEPTEVSERFVKLDAPTKGSYNFNGTTVTLSWDGIKTPNAIDNTWLQNYFNEGYSNQASKYLERRKSYNASNIGTLNYNVYRKEANGDLTLLGKTASTSYSVSGITSDTTFVIKSSYTIFTANMSNGLEIKVKGAVDPNVNNIVEDNPTTPTEPTTPTTPEENNNELE